MSRLDLVRYDTRIWARDLPRAPRIARRRWWRTVSLRPGCAALWTLLLLVLLVLAGSGMSSGRWLP